MLNIFFLNVCVLYCTRFQISAPIQITDSADSSNPVTTSYVWDPMGNLIQMIQDVGGAEVTKTQSFDSIGQKLQINDPDAGVWYFNYDNLGNLVEHQDAKGNIIKYGYDNANRLIWENCVSPNCESIQPEVKYFYDSPARMEGTQSYMPEQVVANDGFSPVPQNYTKGRLTSVIDRYTKNYYSYDRQSKQTTEARSIYAADFNLGASSSITSVGAPDIYFVSRVEYDDLGRVNSSHPRSVVIDW